MAAADRPAVLGIAPVSAADAAALKAIQDYQAKALVRTQQKAEKWIPGLAAITAVLTTAVVVKGPEGFTKLVASRQIFGYAINPEHWIVGLMSVGAILLAVAAGLSYAAAFGNPMSSNAIAERAQAQQVDGAYSAWVEAIRAATKTIGHQLAGAALLTVAGTLALLLAVLLTWTTPEKSDPDSTFCIRVDSQLVTLKGVVPAVKAGVLPLVSC